MKPPTLTINVVYDVHRQSLTMIRTLSVGKNSLNMRFKGVKRNVIVCWKNGVLQMKKKTI